MHFVKRIFDFILPTSCSYCSSAIKDSGIPRFCSSCWDDFSFISPPVCPRCGSPFASPEALSFSPDHECGRCRTNPPLFDQALSVGYFEGPLREAVHQFKYRPCRALGKPLGEWMAKNVRLRSDMDAIIPVPLHSRRLKYRGFNQALLLASCVSAMHNVPLLYDELLRVKETRPQVELKGDERISNVKDAFGIKNKFLLKEKKIVLVDDVFTSGATMNECARVLKDAGAVEVVTLTLARAV